MRIKLNLQIFIFLILFYFTNQIEIYVALIILAFIHELAHILVGIIMGLKPKLLKITAFGFSVYFEKYKKNKKTILQNQKILITLAGPMINILLAIIALCINFDNIFGISKENFIYSNLLIAIFNLLPIYPLDGGRILKNIIARNKMKAESKIILIEQIGYITLLILTAVASLAILYLENIAIFFIVMYLWILMLKEMKHNKLRLRVCRILESQKAQI